MFIAAVATFPCSWQRKLLGFVLGLPALLLVSNAAPLPKRLQMLFPRPERGVRVHVEGKLNRNAPCPCGSGRKYKRCCAR